MLWMKTKMKADSLCGCRRRVRVFVWLLLLFAAGGLVHVIHQNLTEMVQKNEAGMIADETTMQPTETQEEGESDDVTSAVPPMQFPHVEKTDEATTSATLGTTQDADTPPKQRKLLRTSPPVGHTTGNNVTSPSSSSSSASSSSSSSSTTLSTAAELDPALRESWIKLTNTFQSRQNLIKEMCAKFKSNVSKDITRHQVQFLYVSDKYKLLYCQVPKAGCSNWKRTLITMEGWAKSDIEKIEHNMVHFDSRLKNLANYSPQDILKRLNTYTKILFVREPMERLVSAYRDKFENPNDYYHKTFGKHIVARYRANATTEDLNSGNNVKFKEFVTYLLDVNKPVGMDIHWQLVNRLCFPCLLNYDFIGKFENMAEESNFLLRLVGAPRSLKVPTFKDRNPSDKKTSFQITEQYYSQITSEQKQQVYDFYYMDYQMFNYSKPFQDLH